MVNKKLAIRIMHSVGNKIADYLAYDWCDEIKEENGKYIVTLSGFDVFAPSEFFESESQAMKWVEDFRHRYSIETTRIVSDEVGRRKKGGYSVRLRITHVFDDENEAVRWIREKSTEIIEQIVFGLVLALRGKWFVVTVNLHDETKLADRIDHINGFFCDRFNDVMERLFTKLNLLDERWPGYVIKVAFTSLRDYMVYNMQNVDMKVIEDDVEIGSFDKGYAEIHLRDFLENIVRKAQLTELQLKILMLKLEEYKHKEVAEILAISENNARVGFHRAKGKIMEEATGLAEEDRESVMGILNELERMSEGKPDMVISRQKEMDIH